MTDLTRPGWPRPVVDGWPVPWVSPPDDLSNMDAARKMALTDLRTCQVCGMCHDYGDLVFVCVDVPVDDRGHPVDRPDDARYVTPMDEGLLHERCMRLAVKRCPQLATLRAESRLLVVSVPVEDVEVEKEQNFCKLDRARVVEV